MLTAVSDGLTQILNWMSTVITSLLDDAGQLHALLPLFAIGVAISVIMLGVKIIRSFIWGA